MRRTYHGLDLYLGDDLIGRKAKVVYDNTRQTAVVSQRDERGRWSETLTLEATGLTSEKNSATREMVYTWTLADGGTLTGTKPGCNCGGRR